MVQTGGVESITARLRGGEITPAEALRLVGSVRSRSGGGTQEEVDRQRRIDAVMAELDSLTGLERVKQVVREIRAFAEIGRRRAAEGLATDAHALHMIFTGNPGTGKTTVARLLGRLFREMGVLTRGHMVEVERADLVGEYIGHTAQRTREAIARAQGGVLFLDEAYSLARGGEKDFGKESIDCMVRALEDRRGDLLFVLAGYPDEMEWFMAQNPGLRSRFPIRIDFPDYQPKDLVEIARHMFTSKQYHPTGDALAFLTKRLSWSREGNARSVRNIVETAIRCQAVRLVNRSGRGALTRDDLMCIARDDLERAVASSLCHHETPIPE